MKKTLTASLLAAAMLPAIAFSAVETDEEKLSYSLGVLIGERILGNYDELDYDVLMEALKASHAKSELLISGPDANTIVQEYAQKQAEVMSEKAKAEGAAFLAEQEAREGVSKTDSGLLYEVLEAGAEDAKMPAATDKVTVHYEGKLIDGTVFDSSIARGEPTSFALNQVIPGWTEGLQLMREGAKYKLFIPSDLAYGDRGAGPGIGPHQALTFEVELISIDTEESAEAEPEAAEKAPEEAPSE